MEILAVLFAREIQYNPNWTIKSELNNLFLIQCTETKPSKKNRFPKFLNTKLIAKNFVEKVKLTEFEKNFHNKIKN
jgi:hypothetical protein